MTTKGRFYAVSTGPGGEDMLTLQAVRVLGACPVICFPESGSRRVAYQAVSRALDLEQKNVLFLPVPMTAGREKAAAAYEQGLEKLTPFLEQGDDVAFCAIGDVSLYSTAAHLARLLQERGFSVSFVAGVTSFTAAACACASGIVSPDSPVSIVPADACYKAGRLPQAVRAPGAKVFMKCGHSLAPLIAELEGAGLLGRCILVQNASLPEERRFRGEELLHLGADALEKSYLSVLIVTDWSF